VASPIVLHVEHYGTGSPTIVLMHGFGGSARNFRAQARLLQDEYRVVLFDARGHARSDAPSDPAEYQPEAFTDDVLRVIRESRSERAVVGGLSMGAGIALRFAIERPEAVHALVLASFPPPGDRGPSSWALRFADAIDAHGLEAAGSEFVWGGDRFDSEAARLIRQGFLEHRPHALAATLRRVVAAHPSVSELRESLARVTIPTLIVVGSNDSPSLAPSRELARVMPHSKLVEVPDAGHIVNLDKPKVFNEILTSFLRGIDA
jgi:pimeloyl-ACP methyl ester carboxylesterase